MHTVQHLLQSCCSPTGNSRKRRYCVAPPVGLLYLYREQQETCTLCSISCGATVALQGTVGNAQTVQHLLQSYCNSIGNSWKCVRCVATPIELLQLYREQQELHILCSISCSSTGNSRKRIYSVASPVELLELWREQYNISFRATVALQGIVGNVYTLQHLLQNYCSCTRISRKRRHCVVSPVEPWQHYREQQDSYTLCSMPCGATVILQGIVGNALIVQHLLWSYCGLYRE